jgi:hypothetical protein
MPAQCTRSIMENHWSSMGHPRFAPCVTTRELHIVPLIEGLVEVAVEMMGLIGQQRAEGAAVGGKMALAPVDVVAIGDSRLNGFIGIGRDAGLYQ